MLKKGLYLLLLPIFIGSILVGDIAVMASECAAPVSAAPSITLISPNGGQTLEPGTNYDIIWSAVDAENIRILMSLDNGETFSLSVAESELANGVIYHWIVNNYDSDQARIKVEALDVCGTVVASAVSSESFTITGTETLLPDAETTTPVILTPTANETISGTVLFQARTDVPVSALDFDLRYSESSIVKTIMAVGDSAGLSWTGFLNSLLLVNGDYSLVAKAHDEHQRLVGESDGFDLIVNNIILPVINVGLLEPISGTIVSDFIQINALTDMEADALDFVIRPKTPTSSSEPAVAYGLTGDNRLFWTTSFDTRKYPDGAYLIKAKVYSSGTVVGESSEIEVAFDNPETGNISISVSAPEVGATASGMVALVAKTLTQGEAVDFIITEDSAAGGEVEPIIVKATPDLEKRKWTALWESYDATNGSYGLKAKAYLSGTLAGESDLQALNVYNSLVLVGVDLKSLTNNQVLTGETELIVETGDSVDRVDLLILADDSPKGALPTLMETIPSLGNKKWSGTWNVLHELDGRYTLWARAWYQGRSVGESTKVQIFVRKGAVGATATYDLSLSETLAPETDPNTEGEYAQTSVVSSTPTINLNLGLKKGTETEYILPPGTLFKSEEFAAVYYYGRDGKRYVFPDSKTYFTWYGNFNNVRTVGSEVLASVPLGGNITYRPGIRMVKITSDPKVYALARGGTLRWVKSEVVARRLYGTNWNKMIDDVSDSFFFNYSLGQPIEE